MFLQGKWEEILQINKVDLMLFDNDMFEYIYVYIFKDMMSKNVFEV